MYVKVERGGGGFVNSEKWGGGGGGPGTYFDYGI